ncbi:unnamed protein product [Paramecium primaurelia]|uniref:Tetratricopeptide repeat protein n=1 Tax=Paramecium primaurelia TaxID=5886 RepID=A0A8S1L1B8_PARPR|nr:unnamed protein product [Paramecium primaurelia]
MDPILVESHKLIQQQKFEQAFALLQQNESKILSQQQHQNQFHLNTGICCFRLGNYKQAISHLDLCDKNDQEENVTAIKYLLMALIYDQQYERCMKESTLFLQYSNVQILLNIYQSRGQCLQEQGLYLAAIQEYKKSIAKGNKNNIDIAYCYLQLDELQDAEIFVNAYSDIEQSDIQAQLIKAELLLRTTKEKEGAQVLYTAYQYYKSKQYRITDYTPKELEYLESKLNDRNGKYIESFYKKTRTHNLDNDTKNTFLLFVKELNNKQQQELSKQIEEQIKKVLSKTQLMKMHAEKAVEQLLEDQQFKDYYDTFIQCVESTFDRASGFVNRFQIKTDDILITFGIELLAMVPLVGQTVSSVINSLQAEIRTLQIVQRSTALIQIGNTQDELTFLIKQILVIVLQDQNKQKEIKNPEISKSYQNYLRDFLNLKLQIKKQIINQLDDIYIKEKNKQELLAIKDASELLGTYFSSGYLSLIEDKDEEKIPQICAEFVLAEGEQKVQLRKNVSKKIEGQNDKQIIESKCCIIY